jgi:hypothetical protein
MNKLLKNIIMASVAVAITGCSSALEQKMKHIKQAKKK